MRSALLLLVTPLACNASDPLPLPPDMARIVRCMQDSDCPPGYACLRGHCSLLVVDLAIGEPVDAAADLFPAPDLAPLFCGGKLCAFPNASGLCADGVCVMGDCVPGFADCNGTPTDGCEVSTATSPTNCGGCGKVCSASHVAAVACAGGECVGNCQDGYADCNHDKQSDGCETNVAGIDPANCGACGKVCAGNQTCGLGVCCSPNHLEPDPCGCLGLRCCAAPGRRCLDRSTCDALGVCS